jgi:hypothetical protein
MNCLETAAAGESHDCCLSSIPSFVIIIQLSDRIDVANMNRYNNEIIMQK